MKHLDIAGERYGMLVAIELDHISNSRTYWKFRCDCGNVKVIALRSVRGGDTVSCGCKAKAAIKSQQVPRHGESHSRIYSIWRGMKKRCSVPMAHEYERYGGRGIKVCDEWFNSYEAFRDWSVSNGYNDNLTLDRIDGDGNYCPENCRWVDWFVQMRNKDGVMFAKHNGEYLPLLEISKDVGVSYSTIWRKAKAGELDVITGANNVRRMQVCYGRLDV